MLQIDTAKLSELFQDFHTLTNIHICLFDDEFNEVIRYPQSPCAFCSLVRQNKDIDRLCRENDKTAFEKCRASKGRYTYRCHMGLIESATPMFYEDNIIGYVMIGQITDSTSNFENILPSLRHLPIAFDAAKTHYEVIPCVSDDKIRAATHILDACASYLYVYKLVKAQTETVSIQINRFIRQNLKKKITVDMLCRQLHTSRIELYSIFTNLFHTSIGHYIKAQRLEHAKKLLAETDYSINKIAVECGIPDYNYFSKIFKKELGLSAVSFRKQ